MSKYVKNLIADEIRGKLDGVEDAIVADVIGMNSFATFKIRRLMREKGVSMLVVKRSLAGRAAGDPSWPGRSWIPRPQSAGPPAAGGAGHGASFGHRPADPAAGVRSILPSAG